MAETTDAEPRSRGLRIARIVLAGLLLTGVFLYWRFPYPELFERVSIGVRQRSGLQLTVEEIGPSLQWLGPGIAATGMRATQPNGKVWRFDRVVVRPAWSVSWLMLQPAFYTTFEGPIASGRGTVTLDDGTHFNGDLEGVVLEKITEDRLPQGTEITGQADATLDVALSAGGPEGTVQLVAREGTLSHPELPLDVPYEELTGDLVLGGDHALEILALDLKSPLATGTVKGTVGKARSATAAPLRLQIAIKAAGPIRAALNSQGVRVGRDGVINLNVLGTASQPIVR